MTKSKSKQAFELLCDIASRYQELSIDVPEEDRLQTDWRGVGFRLAGHNFIVPLSEVDEILYLPDCTKVPGVKAWVNGVANVRGRLLSVTDLNLFFGVNVSRSSRSRRVMSVRIGDFYCGVIVEQVLGMQTFTQNDYVEKPQVDGKFAPYVNGAYEYDGKSWFIFSLFELVESPAFLQVAV